MKKMSTISIESTRASILRQFKNSFNGSSNYKISAAETHLKASSNPTSIAEAAVDTLSRSKSEEKVRLCNKETSRPTRRLTKRHPNQTRQSFAPSRIPISTASKDRRAKSSAPPSSSTRDDLCYTTPAGTSSLSPSKSILKGRHSCENTSSSRVRSKVTVIQPLFSNERSFSKRVARDAEPPASRSSSSASSLHLREVDSFTLIERSDVPVGRTPRNLNVNPPLSRRLSTSVKEIMQKRQSRIVASKKTSNSLYEIPLGDDFHLDIENELDNILNAVEADNRGGLVNSEVDKSFDADNSQIRRPSCDSRRSFLSSSTCDDPKGKKTHKIRRKIAVAAVSLADKS
ncbi:hypothetical protein BY996DRAFT_6409846 [Phakopsora pachyrhizi]|nr:hypothetical protein BY996DRAFT_6409846 [Phakopsora pachyrhizi]